MSGEGSATPGVVSFEVRGEMTLLDLVLLAQQFARDDDESVRIVASLLDSGRVRLRTAAGRGAERPGGGRVGVGLSGRATGARRPG